MLSVGSSFLPYSSHLSYSFHVRKSAQHSIVHFTSQFIFYIKALHLLHTRCSSLSESHTPGLCSTQQCCHNDSSIHAILLHSYPSLYYSARTSKRTKPDALHLFFIYPPTHISLSSSSNSPSWLTFIRPIPEPLALHNFVFSHIHYTFYIPSTPPRG